MAAYVAEHGGEPAGLARDRLREAVARLGRRGLPDRALAHGRDMVDDLVQHGVRRLAEGAPIGRVEVGSLRRVALCR
jgi:hypothetical protein